MDSVWDNLEQRRELLRRTSENSTREAYAYGKYRTTGWGETAFPDVIEFNLAFLIEPYVAYSFSLNGDQLVDSRFPRCSGGVYRWKQNSKGFYVGAWCFVTVETSSWNIPTTEAEPNYDIDHYFSFTGMGMKDVAEYLADK